MQKTTELKIVLVATMALLCLATAEGLTTKHRLASQLDSSNRGLDISTATIDTVAKQRDWLLKQARLLGKQRDIEAESAAASINLLNRIPAEAKTADAIKPQYEAAKVVINNNSALFAQTDRELAELETHRPQ